MRKKLVSLLMAALMLLSLAAACGNQTTTTPETPASNPTPSAPATADASEIVLFSFIALASLAGVVVLKKVTFAR